MAKSFLLRVIFRATIAVALVFELACDPHNVEVISTSTSPSAPGSGMQSAPLMRMVDVSGAITALNAAAGTIVVSGTTIVVPSTAAIAGDGVGALTFASLQVGWRVTVRASLSGTVTTASVVLVETRYVHGTISGLTGACPAVTFVIDATNASTSAATTFTGVPCGGLANGAPVSVNGVRLQDGSIVATSVAADTTK